MLRLDLILRAFSTLTSEALDALFPAGSAQYQLLPMNSDSNLDQARLHILYSFKPGLSTSDELGGPQALSTRVGVWIITQSLPKKMAVGQGFQTASALEAAFRRKSFPAGPCAVHCEEPYTEDRGTAPDTGRYLIQTNIPWYTVFEGPRAQEV